jgi:hypothetical protein
MHLSVSELFGPSGLAVVDPDGGHWFFGEAVHGVGCIAVDLVPCLVHLVYVPLSKWSCEEVVGSHGVGNL